MSIFRFALLILRIIIIILIHSIPVAPKSIRRGWVLLLIRSSGLTFVKLGQSLAVRPDIIGQQYAEKLQSLQDEMPSFSYKKATAIIENTLGQMDKVFVEFSKTPIAAASIAQVHKGRLHTGEVVAVKILRPNIKKRFMQDIKMFFIVARFAETLFPRLKRLRLVAVVTEMHHWVTAELDLRIEAENALKLKRNFAGHKKFHIPKVYKTYSRENILITEWIDGVRIDNITTLQSLGLDTVDIAKRSTEIFFLQVFRDGFFHADMHPGNMFVLPDGTLCPVDFGIMGRLTKQTRVYVADVLYYIVKQDYEKAAAVHFQAGYVSCTYSINDFANALRAIDIKIRPESQLNTISMGGLLTELFKTTKRYNMKTRPELLLLQKTMVVAEGVGRILAPNENIWLMIQPLMEEWMMVNRGIPARLYNALCEIYNTKHDKE